MGLAGSGSRDVYYQIEKYPDKTDFNAFIDPAAHLEGAVEPPEVEIGIEFIGAILENTVFVADKSLVERFGGDVSAHVDFGGFLGLDNEVDVEIAGFAVEDGHRSDGLNLFIGQEFEVFAFEDFGGKDVFVVFDRVDDIFLLEGVFDTFHLDVLEEEGRFAGMKGLTAAGEFFRIGPAADAAADAVDGGIGRFGPRFDDIVQFLKVP